MRRTALRGRRFEPGGSHFVVLRTRNDQDESIARVPEERVEEARAMLPAWRALAPPAAANRRSTVQAAVRAWVEEVKP